MDSVLTGATDIGVVAAEPARSTRRPPTTAASLVPRHEYMFSRDADMLARRLAEYRPASTDGQEAAGVQMVRRAYAVAYEAHDGQKRNSGEPYIIHPIAVANILLDLRLDPASIAAALLHDVVEDTPVTVEMLETSFGPEVSRLVDGVTKLSSLEGESLTKEDMQASTYRKMFIAMADDPRVVLVKLADRLHNMRTIKAQKEESKQRNARETLEIYAPLAHRLGISQLKWELEDRSFAIIAPDEYQRIKRYLSSRRQEREVLVERVKSTLSDVLKDQGIAADITGRPKHIYSIYRKMKRKNVEFDQIYDQLAVRVIVNTVAECYQVLGVVHGQWAPVPGEFDDYIANPKESMYRSLHTTVLIPGGQPCEVQIRTHEMHDIAEHGIAAHWRYKEGFSRSDATFETKMHWLRSLIEWRHDLTDPKEFIESLKIDEFDERVYVMTPKGRVIDLPVGATPVDFAYRIHSEIGNTCVGAKVNNRIVTLAYELKSGEVVDIVTLKASRGPSRDWLSYVKTSAAKTHIRRFFKRQHREDNMAAGRDMLERELKPLALNVSHDEIATLIGIKSIDDLFVQIGSGDVSARSIAQRLMQSQQLKEKNSLDTLPPTEPAGMVAQPVREPETKGVLVDGKAGMLTRMAKCCSPLRGEPIIGFVSRGKGVTVHRADCRNMELSHEQDRVIDVSWGDIQVDKRQGAPVMVRIEVWDRVGLWRDVTGAIADEKINIERVDQYPGKLPNRTVLMTTLTISSISQLMHILDKLNRMPDVIEARRDCGIK